MINVAAAIIIKENRILAAKKRAGLHLAGHWEFPGGKVEESETPEECLERELYEEFGVSCKVGEFLASSVHNYPQKRIRLLGYFVLHTAGDFTLSDHDEIRWLTMDELLSLTWAPADIPLVEALFNNHISEQTCKYYDNCASEYSDKTIHINMAEIRETFTKHLPKNGHILDLGCGSGRDSYAFLRLGFSVTALEPSLKLAQLASSYIGQNVLQKKAQDMSDQETYDGIWACASLVHIPEQEFTTTLQQLTRSLKPGGVIYISLKQTEQHWDDLGRFYNGISTQAVKDFFTTTGAMRILDLYDSPCKLDASRPLWQNLLAQKSSTPEHKEQDTP